jgi:cellulose synthase/poly-beta-1,6-N-acetylglucosamine synthase-like glycosyltransferase
VQIDSLMVLLALASFGLLIYAYAGYPVLLWLLGRFLPARRTERDEDSRWPKVSIVLSAYNEEAVIDARIRNLLEQDYPAKRLEILVGSDGSTDRTCEIARSWWSDRLRLVAFAERRGKASVLNNLIALARGEIVVLTDADTFFRPDAVRELVLALRRHPSACAVVGRLELRSSSATGNLDGAYCRYDMWVRMLESRFGCVSGASGAIYAFPRERYQFIPNGAIIDDFLIPVFMRLHRGGQVFFVPTARSWGASPELVRDEFRRRVRMGAGDLQALRWMWPLLLPRNGMVAVAYISHKLLRWLGPLLLLVGFGVNLWLLGIPFFRLLLLGQFAGYGLALVAPWLRRVPVLGVAASALRYFVVLNAALLVGFVKFAFGAARPFWTTTPRQVEVEGTPERHGAAASASSS